MTVSVAAVDLGASSGRVIVGRVGPGVLDLQAVARFSNDPVRTPDGLHWNLLELFRQSLLGLRAARELAGSDLVGIGIDSWAVDYGLIGDGRLLGTPYHYRDEGRAAGVDTVHARVIHEELYQRNGLQFLPFNTLYQLAADPLGSQADHLLLIPDLLAYWLTGEMVTERTNASTTGLLNVHSGQWDLDLIDRLGFPRRVFGSLVDPGQVIGSLLPSVGERIGSPVHGGGLTVSAVGSHDTASAVVGVPIQSDDAAYISCGTWGLVGVELSSPVVTEASRAANFTNEGGVDGRVRFLTNVMGLWLLSETMREWERAGEAAGGAQSLPELLATAALVNDAPVFDVQDERFLPPGDMPARIGAWLTEHDLPVPQSRPAMVRCIINSLAQAFATAVDQAEALSGKVIRVVHVVGGGALNTLLCQATADRSGRVVLAGPVEATAIGNVLIQGRTAGAVSGDLESLRSLVAATSDIARYEPRPERRDS